MQDAMKAETASAVRYAEAGTDASQHALARESLLNRLEVLDSRAERLIHRIDAILVPHDSPPSVSPSASYPSASAETDFLRMVESRLDDVCRRLDAATDRIDL